MSRPPESAAGRVHRLSLRQKVIASFVIAYAILTGSFLYLIVVNLHRMAEEELVNAAVITSYSIHYTKLYESSQVMGSISAWSARPSFSIRRVARRQP